jgi:hypothetical protein
MTSTEWMNDAACRGKTEYFYSANGKKENIILKQRRELIAKQICSTCVHIEPCRALARENDEYGIWGGENEDDRFRAGYMRSNAIYIRQSKPYQRLKDALPTAEDSITARRRKTGVRD